MTTITIEEKREILEQVLEKMDECAELLRSLHDEHINAYCLAAFEGEHGGWLGRQERDIIDDALAALDDEPDEDMDEDDAPANSIAQAFADALRSRT